MGEPEGKLAKPGRKVVVKYQGKLEKTGKTFDESKGKGFNFRLGAVVKLLFFCSIFAVL